MQKLYMWSGRVMSLSICASVALSIENFLTDHDRSDHVTEIDTVAENQSRESNLELIKSLELEMFSMAVPTAVGYGQ